MSEDKLLRQDFTIYILNNFVTKKKILKIHYNDFFQIILRVFKMKISFAKIIFD